MIRNQTAQGFTLIEVLIAMTLLSIMMALLFGSMKICAESWEKGENKIAEVSNVTAVINFFQRHLIPAEPLWNDFSNEEKDGEKLLSFQGRAQAFQFVSAFPASAGRAGLQLISVALDKDNGEQVLKVTLTPFFPVGEGGEWFKEEEILLRNVSFFSLTYFGSEDGQAESRWQDEWIGKDRQPQLVKINIGLENEMYWPEMIFPLKATESVESAGITFAEDAAEGNDGEQTLDPENYE
ncbi:prepilin-type N-terminal cleavage/methylation domain-containing protein [Methylosarcina fibrata]|uniref:prepilin-type N-terminal cleavage/methylation domain-containing protein n=1 Tax=Methylosarcina fibrata TaxID=105972 RepID=UPI0003710A6B|nr:prepilin-type N-terminal cleavage/methylation domain-containing protein [Methylosarcina fibrata]